MPEHVTEVMHLVRKTVLGLDGIAQPKIYTSKDKCPLKFLITY